MWNLDAFYHENIKPIVQEELYDFLDLGGIACPEWYDLDDDVQAVLASKLFIQDSDNLDVLADFDLRYAMGNVVKTNSREDKDDLANLLTGKIIKYYKDTITEILEYEYKEIKCEYDQGLREDYDQEC